MPTPKAVTPFLSGWTLPDTEHICTAHFFNTRKEGLPALSEDRRHYIDRKVKEAIAFYVCQMELPLRQRIECTNQTYDPRSCVTSTERNKAIRRIVTAAQKVERALRLGIHPELCDKAVPQLERVYREADFNTNILVNTTLGIQGGDFHEMVAQLRFSHLRPPLKATLELLERLARLVIREQTGPRYANPVLELLVTALIPFWHEATGRTHRRTNSSQDNNSKKGTRSFDAKRYLFAAAIIDMLKNAKAKVIPSLDQIDKISQKYRLKK